jgi:hypothetical protein
VNNEILRKRLSSFKTEKNKIRDVSDELLIDILRAWEAWTGSYKDFYNELGLSKMQLTTLIKKGKKLNREGQHLSESGFKELKLLNEFVPGVSVKPRNFNIELEWNNRVIRFSQVRHLIDFITATNGGGKIASEDFYKKAA